MLPVFDAHSDTLFRLLLKRERLDRNTGHIDLARCPAPYAQFFAFWGYPYHELLALFSREVQANESDIVHCRTADDCHAAWQAGKTAAFLSIEGGDMIGCKVENLVDAYMRDGVRMVGLTWNHANALCGSCRELTELGLTERGRAFVNKAFELGMLVDLSHASDAAFADTCELAGACGKPIVCSHSNARALCGHVRNLTDEQFTKVRDLGGIVGLNLFPYFINGQAECSLDEAVGHLERWLSLGGEDTIALGADWDGCETDEGVRFAGNLKGIDELSGLYDILYRRNWSEAVMEKLFYRNMMRVITECC